MATILVAEDDVQIMRVLAMWLSRNGHEVMEARDGQEAIDALSQRAADLIITDVNMPRVDGLALARWVRQEAALTIPIIVLSSRCDQASMSEAMSVHGIKVHPKPFSPSRLLDEIHRLLQSTTAAESEATDAAPADRKRSQAEPALPARA